MPPKGVRKFGKGKAKGKAKAKARVVVPVAADGAEVEVGEGVLAVMSSPAKPKSSGLRKKLLGEIGERTIDDVLSDHKNVLATADATIAEAAALEQAQEAQSEAAEGEYNQAKKGVESAIEQETAAAGKYREAKERRTEALAKVEKDKHALMDAQKRVALLEVYAMNDRRMKELEEKRRAASEAAEAAKKFLAEQRQKEKEALEATRKALEEARALKGGGKGRRAAGGEPSPKKPAVSTEPDTVPATLVDGEDIE